VQIESIERSAFRRRANEIKLVIKSPVATPCSGEMAASNGRKLLVEELSCIPR
jgi:hypothetical protein